MQQEEDIRWREVQRGMGRKEQEETRGTYLKRSRKTLCRSWRVLSKRVRGFAIWRIEGGGMSKFLRFDKRRDGTTSKSVSKTHLTNGNGNDNNLNAHPLHVTTTVSPAHEASSGGSLAWDSVPLLCLQSGTPPPSRALASPAPVLLQEGEQTRINHGEEAMTQAQRGGEAARRLLVQLPRHS
ncbi:hypothetical protein BKA70DRAFT_1324471 [Coprinopsis sp. MPI-PUGE-AT-0042]|nr:hypothetical protein BKA70DRAFT_1324471 [Coprinopsis sp. MPI-PUGE-AT-0042]